MRTIDSRLAKDAELVQNGCNPSGIILSFAEGVANNDLGPDHPYCVAFASKIGSLAGVFSDDQCDDATLEWSAVVDECRTVADKMQGLDTLRKCGMDEYIQLAKGLGRLTRCHQPDVCSQAFEMIRSNLPV